MNREILFRGKRDDNGEWVYGYFVADALEQIGRDCPMGWIRYYNDDTEKVEIYQIDRKTVGQYTGLKDKNGTKIFEGDIVMFNKGRKLPNYKHCPELIKWNKGDCAFQRYPCGKSITIHNDGKLIQPDMMVECEVIGNIYDNPELLEVRDD